MLEEAPTKRYAKASNKETDTSPVHGSRGSVFINHRFGPVMLWRRKRTVSRIH